MRRTPAARGFALLSLVLLGIGWTGEAHDLRPCPHHAAGAAEGEGAAHPGHGAAHAEGPAPAGEGERGHGPCTCLGDCSGGLPLVLRSHPPGIDRAAPATASGLRPAAAPRPSPTLLPYVLPWTLAPPAALV